MTYEVLARKWRPQSFDDVIGQEHVTQTLLNAVRSGRIAHAYLFGGPRGVGKTSVARILAKAINCEEKGTAIPCNQCTACREITDGSSVDVMEIDGASNRGIDEIRELRENIKYMPSSGRYRVYIIDEVHMLTLPAFNALLKTLEEPPGHVKFIFATTEAHKVPVTILSRCQRFDFKRIAAIKIGAHLDTIAREEGIQISSTGQALIAREAEGSMRDAESLLDQVVSFTGPKVEDRYIADILGIVDRDLMYESSRSIIEGSPSKCLEIVDTVYSHGYDIKEFYKMLMEQMRNLLVLLIAPQAAVLDLSEQDREDARRQAQRAGKMKLQTILDLLITREQDLRFASHPRLVLEAILLRACTIGDVLSFETLLERIATLEKDLINAGAPTEPDPSLHASDPVGPWTQGATEDPPARAKDWGAFLDVLSSKNKSMFNVLKEWEFVRFTEDQVELRRGRPLFSAAYFDDPERLRQLTTECRAFFQKDFKIRVLENSGSGSPQRMGSPLPDRGDPRKKYADLPPPVRDILQVFQGEIKGAPANSEKAAKTDGIRDLKKEGET